MARTKKEPNRVDNLLDDLLEDCHSPEDILGESGLMKQIKKRLVERALAGELNHHLLHFDLGRTHDFKLFKAAGIHMHPDTGMLGDSGYQGITRSLPCQQLYPEEKTEEWRALRG